MENHSNIAIFGYPRSGSTMLYCMLRSTVVGYHFYDREVQAVKANRTPPFIPKITKNPMDMVDVRYLSREVPGIKFVLCIRDPRSVLCSKTADGRFKVNWNYCVHKKKGKRDRNAGFMERDHLARETLKFKPYIHKYEETLLYPDKSQKEIGEFLGVEYKGKFTSFHKKVIPVKLTLRLNGKRPIEKERIDSWKQYPERIIQQFEDCPALFEVLEFWGYEKDHKWFEELKKGIKC